MNDRNPWDEAAERVGAYLAALGLGGAEARMRETIRVIETARRACQASPATTPLDAAMTEVQRSLALWLTSIAADAPPETTLASLLAADALGSWPDLPARDPATGPLPAVVAQPEIDLSSMAARDMNFGAMETIAQETWQKFDWAPVLRAAALWTAIFFLSLYLYDRFFAP